MFKVGELVKFRNPLDADYSYGTIVEIDSRSVATILGSGYYTGVTTAVHLRYIEKAKRGGNGYGGGKKYSKRSTP